MIDLTSGYRSPITMLTERIATDIAQNIDDGIWQAVTKVGFEVDRDELIKALRYDRSQYEDGYYAGYRKGIEPKWIPVEEELPEKDGLYIIVGRSGTPHAAHYYTGKRGFSNPYATHWMPMPEPPKGEQE